MPADRLPWSVSTAQQSLHVLATGSDDVGAIRDALRIRCIDLVENATDYLDGALSDDDAQRFADHLALCAACAEFLEQLRLLASLTPQVVDRLDHPPPRYLDALVEEFRRRTRATS